MTSGLRLEHRYLCAIVPLRRSRTASFVVSVPNEKFFF